MFHYGRASSGAVGGVYTPVVRVSGLPPPMAVGVRAAIPLGTGGVALALASQRHFGRSKKKSRRRHRRRRRYHRLGGGSSSSDSSSSDSDSDSGGGHHPHCTHGMACGKRRCKGHASGCSHCKCRSLYAAEAKAEEDARVKAAAVAAAKARARARASARASARPVTTRHEDGCRHNHECPLTSGCRNGRRCPYCVCGYHRPECYHHADCPHGLDCPENHRCAHCSCIKWLRIEEEKRMREAAMAAAAEAAAWR